MKIHFLYYLFALLCWGTAVILMMISNANLYTDRLMIIGIASVCCAIYHKD